MINAMIFKQTSAESPKVKVYLTITFS